MINGQYALKVRRFIEGFCILSKSPWCGKKVQLLPWQWNDVILPIYGNVDENGHRIVSKAAIFIPKKQGKSSLLSCLSIFALMEQPGSECYIISGSVEQSQAIFAEAANMAEAHPALAKRLWVRRNIKAIEDKKGKSILKVLSSDGPRHAGKNANFIAADETCFWGSGAREVWDELVYAGAARTNRLLISISTAGSQKEHIGYELYRQTKEWKEKPPEERDPHFHGVIYEIEEHEDWKNPDNWRKANPSMGVTVPEQFYYDEYAALKDNPMAETGFRQRLCNQWTGSAERFIPSHIWSQCAERFEEKQFHGQPCICSIDAARKSDLFSYVISAQRDGVIYLMPRFFIPANSAERKEKYDNVPYRTWANLPNSNLYLTSGDCIDPSYVVNKLVEDSKRFQFVECRFDPYGMELMRQTLERDHRFTMVEIPQTARYMSPATADFERRCHARTLRHPDNPVLNWNVENAKPVERHDQIMVEKSAKANRIDGLVASILCLTYYLADNTKPTFDRNTVIWT